MAHNDRGHVNDNAVVITGRVVTGVVAHIVVQSAALTSTMWHLVLCHYPPNEVRYFLAVLYLG